MRRLVSILFATTGLMLFAIPAFATGDSTYCYGGDCKPCPTVTVTKPGPTVTATETATEKATVKVTATKQVYIGGDTLAKTGFDYPLWVWYTLGSVLIAGAILIWVTHRYKGKHEA